MSYLHRTVLHEGPIAALALVTCRHPGGGPALEEEAPRHSIDLPLSGVFVRDVAGTRVVGSAGSLLFYNRGEVQRVSHPTGGGDACLSLGISDAALADALSLPRDRPAEGAPFARAHLPVDPAWAADLYRLGRRLMARVATALEVEETALLLARALAAPLARQPRRPARRETPRARREKVEAVQLLLASDPGRDWSLADLAREVGGSPFHLTRTFATEVGVPLHRWAVRRRLVLSLEPVAEGVRLADVAFGLGFASHAHFSVAFARAFGLPPTAFRASVEKAAGRRKNVKA